MQFFLHTSAISLALSSQFFYASLMHRNRSIYSTLLLRQNHSIETNSKIEKTQSQMARGFKFSLLLSYIWIHVDVRLQVIIGLKIVVHSILDGRCFDTHAVSQLQNDEMA